LVYLFVVSGVVGVLYWLWQRRVAPRYTVARTQELA
jgi:hypothetical protein